MISEPASANGFCFDKSSVSLTGVWAFFVPAAPGDRGLCGGLSLEGAASIPVRPKPASRSRLRVCCSAISVRGERALRFGLDE